MLRLLRWCDKPHIEGCELDRSGTPILHVYTSLSLNLCTALDLMSILNGHYISGHGGVYVHYSLSTKLESLRWEEKLIYTINILQWWSCGPRPCQELYQVTQVLDASSEMCSMQEGR